MGTPIAAGSCFRRRCDGGGWSHHGFDGGGLPGESGHSQLSSWKMAVGARGLETGDRESVSRTAADCWVDARRRMEEEEKISAPPTKESSFRT